MAEEAEDLYVSSPSLSSSYEATKMKFIKITREKVTFPNISYLSAINLQHLASSVQGLLVLQLGADSS